MEMNWEALGALAELLGAIAVLATLYYLSLQIKINSKEITKSSEIQRAQSTYSTNEMWINIWQPLMQDPALAEIYLKGIRGEPLTDVESFRFCVYINTFLAMVEAVYNQVKAETSFAELAEVSKLFELINPYLDKLLNTSIGNDWLSEEAPSLFTPEFLEDLHSSRLTDTDKK